MQFSYQNNLEWCPNFTGFSAYVIILTNGKMYKGHTQDFRQRMLQHFNGTGCRTTKISKPVYVLHHEEFETRKEAVVREVFFKSIEGFNWLKSQTDLKTIKP